MRPRHQDLAAALLEPFSAALENDRRLHELATLREAAEAERRSLLTRIGRQEISEEIVGAESGLKLVMERVALVAQSDVPVLILGETGTGKEVVSRAIHSRSIRGAGPFIRVNCGAIPPELIDSQLFGHEKGSFTGAAETRKGWFERADGGTLFLDEIGELPLAAQVRLLRVLQDGLVERVGGEQPMHVDVRIVAATHRELGGDGQAGHVSRRLVVSRQRISHPVAAAARASGGYPRPGSPLRSARGQPLWIAVRGAERRRSASSSAIFLAGEYPRVGSGD